MNCKQDACAKQSRNINGGSNNALPPRVRMHDTTSLILHGDIKHDEVLFVFCSLASLLKLSLGNRAWGGKTTRQSHFLTVLHIKIYSYSGHHHHHHATMFVGRFHVGDLFASAPSLELITLRICLHMKTSSQDFSNSFSQSSVFTWTASLMKTSSKGSRFLHPQTLKHFLHPQVYKNCI